MKNLLYIFFALLIVSTSCNREEDDIFDKTPQQRKQELKKKYLDIIHNSEFGWKVQVEPGREDVGVYNYFINFNKEKGKAFVSTDADIMEFASKLDSSLYEVRYTQEMTLSFTTYSQINIFYQPTSEDVNGFGGDVDLLFKEVSPDKIVLEGKTNGGKYTFTKAESNEYVAMLDEIRNIELNLAYITLDDEYKFPTLTLKNGKKLFFKINWLTRGVLLRYNKGTELVERFIKVNFDNKGMILQEPVELDGQKITRLNFDEDNYKFVIADEGVEGELTIDGLPAYSGKGLVDIFEKIKFGPITGWSKPAKTLRRALEGINDRFTTLQYYNDPKVFIGWSFKFSDESEWPHITFKGKKFEKLGEDRLRFVPDQVVNEPGGTIDLNEVLKTPEAKAIYDILFAPEGFVLYREIGVRLISLKDPYFWILMSDFSD